VLAVWSERLPVGYGLTGSGDRPETQNSGSDRDTTAGPYGGVASGAIQVAPPPLLLPIEPPVESAISASEPSGKHSQLSTPTTRKRVVLLPHAADQPPDT
jgi:hypothetical protein